MAVSDTVAAWRLSGQSAASETTLVAAAFRGHVVRVDTFAGGNALGRLALVPGGAPPTLQAWAQVILVLVLPLIAGIIIARHNLRAKRGDVRGALVVGISIALLSLIVDLLSTNIREVGLFTVILGITARTPLGHALSRGVVMAIGYLAIEPYVRRLWPSVLVSWARLVAGRLRDPIIGRDVLVGASIGAALQFLAVVSQSAERALGFPVATAQFSWTALGAVVNAPSALAYVCITLVIGLQRATIGYTLLLVFRFVFRNDRLAITAVLLFFFLAFLDFGSKAIWVDGFVWFLTLAASLWVFMRFGYVASVAIVAFGFMGDGLGWTLDFGSWLAPQTMFAWGIVALALIYGFMTAVGGKSIFRDPLSDPAAGVRARR